MFMCLGAAVVVDCVMWYDMLCVLFCVCVSCLFALFACVIRLWYSVRCCIVWFCVVYVCLSVFPNVFVCIVCDLLCDVV